MSLIYSFLIVFLTGVLVWALSICLSDYSNEFRFWKSVIRKVFNHYFGGLRYGY